MTNMENGRDYLQHVLNCLCTRLAQIDQAILEGEKEVEDMHEYYWENYTEMTSMVMRTMITSRHCSTRCMRMKNSFF